MNQKNHMLYVKPAKADERCFLKFNDKNKLKRLLHIMLSLNCVVHCN